MKGFITKALSAFGLSCGLFTCVGCCPHYHDIVDPCWPERYRAMARREVYEGLNAQVQNGHILDQTVWNHDFEPGTAKLTPGGIDHLQYVVRRRPCPDTTVYVQTAQDVGYDPAAPERLSEGRTQLNSERVASVLKYLNAEAAGRNLTFNVVVHDPAIVDLPGITANGVARLRILGGYGGSIGSSGGVPQPQATTTGSSQAWQ